MRLSDAMALLNSRPNGRKPVFSIKFLKWNKDTGKGGDEVFIEKATTSGVTHNAWENGTVGVKPVIGSHPYPVHILLILELNGSPIYN
jgi:hypothetical protein